MGINNANQIIKFLAYEYTLSTYFYPKSKHYITNLKKNKPKENQNTTKLNNKKITNQDKSKQQKSKNYCLAL